VNELGCVASPESGGRGYVARGWNRAEEAVPTGNKPEGHCG